LGGNACCSHFIKEVEEDKFSPFCFSSAETGQDLNICATDNPEEKNRQKKGPQDRGKKKRLALIPITFV